MSPLTVNGVEEAVVETLERFAFVNLWPAGADEREPCEFRVQVSYAGDGERGCLRLAASRGFLRELTSGLLGVDEDEVDVEEDGLDALGELGNVLAGQVVGLLGGQERPIRLSLPEPLPGDTAFEPPRLESWLRCEQGTLHVALCGGE